MPEQDATTRLEQPSQGGATDPTTPQPLVAGAETGHLVSLAQAAATAFLGVLALGGLSLVAIKLQYPNLGAGANIIDVFSSVVILALSLLRVPVHLGDLTLTVLPLGALVAVFFIVRWACRVAVPSATPRRGLVVGAIFGVIAALAALIFRLRFEPDALYAGAVGSAVAGFIWVALFSALAFAGSKEPLSKIGARRLATLRGRAPWMFEGVRAGALMLLLAAVLGTVAGLLWAILLLLGGGGPHDLDGGDLIAALVYVAAFAPNLVATVVALSLGAPVEVGAGLTVHGKLRGNLEGWSVLSDGAGLSFLLLLVPFLACSASGYWARRNSSCPEQVVRTLAVASVLFASVLALLAWLGEARLGAQLASSRGFAVVAPRAGILLLLGGLWGGGAGYLGWAIADRRKGS